MIAPTSASDLVNLREIAEIEIFILKRMKELTLGDHASVYKGAGFHFVGTRDWEPGDRTASIDWAQSSLNNFSPLITREFEQDSNAVDRRRGRRLAVHAVRRPRRDHRDRHRARGGRGGPVGGVLSGPCSAW